MIKKPCFLPGRFGIILTLFFGLLLPQMESLKAEADASSSPTNKLLYMYRFFYLPFSIDFTQGVDKDEILPHVMGKNRKVRLLNAGELTQLDLEWEKIRQDWMKRSLFLNTPVKKGKSTIISRHLRSHVIDLSQTALSKAPIAEQVKVKHALANKSLEIRQAFLQIRFLKSFLGAQDEGKLNFFIVGASWCQSTKEYRALFESYFKKFAHPEVNLHSLIVEDPKEKIFESQLLAELFPRQKQYSHNSIPKFIAIETVKGQPRIYEEGDALRILYDRFFAKKRGFLNDKVALFSSP